MTNRNDIREYVADALSAIAPNIYPSRGYATAGASLPAVVVYTPRERVEYQTIGATVRSQREPQVIVEYMCEGPSSVIESLLDDAADEIEAVLLRDMSLGGLVEIMMLTGSESTVQTDDKSGLPLGIIQLTFTAQYGAQIEVV